MTARRMGKAALIAARYGADICRSLREHATAPRRSRITFPRRVAEQWRLLITNGITAEDYYHYRLDRAEVAWAAKRQFIGVMNHGSWRDPLNPPAYHGFAEDKVISSRYLAQAGVPVPPLLAVFGPHGRAATGEPVRTADELVDWLSTRGLEHVVLKPERGTRGIGILVIGERLRGAPGAAWQRVPSQRIDGAGFAAHFARHRGHAWFVVEERLRPHQDLAPFGDQVLHTARVVTMMDGGVDVIGASLRIGTGASGVDNFSQGNLVAPVDVTTGRIGPAASKAGDRVTIVRAHPRTGAAIEGFVIPDWSAALAVVTRACQRVPFSRLLGWDVGITAGGPVIVEVNARWDADVLQLAADRGLLATSLRRHLEARGMLNRLGLGIAWPASSGGGRAVR